MWDKKFCFGTIFPFYRDNFDTKQVWHTDCKSTSERDSESIPREA